MDLVAGAMGNLTTKLLQLLQDEYRLQTGVKAEVKSLAQQLEAMHIALCKVAQVPYDELDPQVKLWARDAREASYDMEDILDTFLLRVDNCHQPTDAGKGHVRRLIKDIHKKFNLTRIKARHDIAVAIEDIKKQVDEMAKRRDRHRVDEFVVNSATTTIIDPRLLMTLHTKASELVGIDKSKDALVNMLTLGDERNTKIVSVVGSGGLGKTTLAKVVYEKLTVDMNTDCKAFVPVGRNPNLKKVLRDILLDLDKEHYMNKGNFMMLDERQLSEEIHAFLNEKRYFIVIDDIWEVPSWKAIKTILKDNNLGSKIMITTRCSDVAELVHRTYKIHPLDLNSSKRLFYGRIFGSEDSCPEFLAKLSDKILKKCGGVPLAIITIASLLANKSGDIGEWQKVSNSIGSGLISSNDVYYDMRKILSLSYYDLPSQMRTCFLYLSMYPEDYEIDRDRLIWRWVSEGFIQPQRNGDDLFKIGKSYFNNLINRSLVQPTVEEDGEVYACRVHDMILDLICSFSREENFVTNTSSDIEQVTSLESKRFRRLCLKNSFWPQKGVSQVRSIAVFGPCYSVLSFSCLDMIRVLDLECCSLEGYDGSKMYIGNLLHLRYLGLRGTCLKVLPRGIEKLKFLQVLKTDGDIELPKSIFGLRGLMCLDNVRCCPGPGNLLRNLVSLQMLDTLYLEKDSIGAVEALGHLTQLTVLEIFLKLDKMVDQIFFDALMKSLDNMPRLQFLRIMSDDFIRPPPPHLWISPTSLPDLTYVDIMIRSGGPKDIQVLGTLPKLLVLWLRADRQNFLERPLKKYVVSPDAFPRLKRCYFYSVLIVPSVFTRGAMPWVEEIYFQLRVKDFFSNLGGLDFDDLAMVHLASLQKVHCDIYSDPDVTGAGDVWKALKLAGDVHPNHPKLWVHTRTI